MSKYCRIIDKHHPDLTAFRIQSILECGGTEEFLNYDYKDVMNSNANRKEDIWRFTNIKWNDTSFDHIDCHYADDVNITCISGAVIIGDWIKGAVYHFGLRKYAKQYPSRLFWDGGFLDRLKEYALDNNKLGIFITIFPHEPRLKTLCKKLKDGSGITTQANINLIRSLKYRGTHEYNYCKQEFFAVELTNQLFEPKDLLGH